MQRFTVFGRPDCGYCVRAKQLLQAKKYEFRWVDINAEGISKADLEKTVGKRVDTVPQIFHGQQHIGGFTELNHYIDSLKTSEKTS